MPFRLYDAPDLEAILAVSLATGLAGGDASHLHQDGRLIGLIHAAPYAELEPDLALVAEDDQGVCGYAVGTLDTPAWEARLEREWWPALRESHARPVGPAAGWSADDWRRAIIHSPGHTPEAVTQAFPAHLHLNLLSRMQGQGVGRRLLEAWLARARDRGAKAVHVGVSPQNARGLRFWARCGFEPLDVPAKRTVWMGRAEA